MFCCLMLVLVYCSLVVVYWLDVVLFDVRCCSCVGALVFGVLGLFVRVWC